MPKVGYISMSDHELIVTRVSWAEAEPDLRTIRTLVFIEEQKVPVALEWDNADQSAVHVLVISGHEPIATARLLETGQIGRMAVLKEHRRRGVGKTMLKKLLNIAREMQMTDLFLNAQLDAIEFYERFGFIVSGETFNDAGIPHKRMSLTLPIDKTG